MASLVRGTIETQTIALKKLSLDRFQLAFLARSLPHRFKLQRVPPQIAYADD
jgi:hypothetical protein